MTATWTATVHWVDCGNCRTGTHPKPGPFDKISHAMPPHQYRARGRVFKVGDTWCCEVIVGGKVVNADNTSHWRTIFDGCNEAVWAFDRVLSTGHRIKKTWAELVDGAK